MSEPELASKMSSRIYDRVRILHGNSTDIYKIISPIIVANEAAGDFLEAIGELHSEDCEENKCDEGCPEKGRLEVLALIRNSQK